jgi:hypothetical protein
MTVESFAGLKEHDSAGGEQLATEKLTAWKGRVWQAI